MFLPVPCDGRVDSGVALRMPTPLLPPELPGPVGPTLTTHTGLDLRVAACVSRRVAVPVDRSKRRAFASDLANLASLQQSRLADGSPRSRIVASSRSSQECLDLAVICVAFTLASRPFAFAPGPRGRELRGGRGGGRGLGGLAPRPRAAACTLAHGRRAFLSLVGLGPLPPWWPIGVFV